MHALTEPDEHGNCHLLNVLHIDRQPHVVAVFTIHEKDLPSLARMLVESLDEADLEELRETL